MFRRYAKGRFAVHKSPVILYADVKFYFKKVQFSSRNTTKYITNKVKRSQFLSALSSLALILDISSFMRLNIHYWDRNIKNYPANTSKLTFA